MEIILWKNYFEYADSSRVSFYSGVSASAAAAMERHDVAFLTQHNDFTLNLINFAIIKLYGYEN